MQHVFPNYYKKFKCINKKCRHNCCIGWEIDIDDETAEFYKEVPGPFGDRLRKSIDYTDAYCFKLKDGQCPFLPINRVPSQSHKLTGAQTGFEK